MKIGIYGGTFNPIHMGHIIAAQTAAAILGLEKLLLVPAGIPPHKALPDQTPSPEHRLNMTNIAADRMAMRIPVEVLDLEIRREGKSYTSDTLRFLKGKYPEDELWLMMGTDMFLSLHTWHEPEVILSLAGICAFGRTKQDGEELLEPQREYLIETYQTEVVTIILPYVMDISSTQLRRQLANQEQPVELEESVYGYILRHGLYGTHADLTKLTYPKLRAASYSMIKAKRIPHIQGTEKEAVKLAGRWGVDEDLARTAAILHDCTKYLNLEEQLKLCNKYGILLDAMEQTTLKLLHSKTGAGVAREVFGVCDEIYEAIFWHTTGKADMTRLEKVIYIADYMEPSRDFPGVEKLRALAYEDLDAAVLLGLEMGIEEMEKMGNPVHYRTVEARDWLKARLR